MCNSQEDIDIMSDRNLYVGIPDNLTLHLEFNNDCNLKCKFCIISQLRDKPEREIFCDKYLYNYLVPLYSKTSNLIPTSGEITYGKEGFEYLSYIHKNYPHINIFMETNGLAFNENWANLASDNLMRVNFSMNCINEEYFRRTVYDKIGLYDIIQDNFERYLQILKEKSLWAFKPTISCVLNTTNFHTIEEFIKIYLKKGIQQIIFYMDLNYSNLYYLPEDINSQEYYLIEKIEKAYEKIIEIRRVLEGKALIIYELFVPIKNLDLIKKRVYEKDINILKEKYKTLLDLAQNMDFKKLYKEKTEIRNKFGKRKYSLYEEVSGVTFHQDIQNCTCICTNPFQHLTLRANGDFNICSWRSFDCNINEYIENENVNWDRLFNSLYYRKLRKNFLESNYEDCLNNCPGAIKYSKEEYEKNFTV